MGIYNIAYSDFWDMSPEELFRMNEELRPRDMATDYAGTLTNADLDELQAMCAEEWGQ